MNSIIKILYFSMLVLISNSVLANSSFGPVKIENVYVSDANILVIKIQSDGASSHSEQCDAGRERDLAINQESPYEKEMFSIALTAFAAGKSITGYVNGCHNFWNYKMPKLTVISVGN